MAELLKDLAHEKKMLAHTAEQNGLHRKNSLAVVRRANSKGSTRLRDAVVYGYIMQRHALQGKVCRENVHPQFQQLKCVMNYCMLSARNSKTSSGVPCSEEENSREIVQEILIVFLGAGRGSGLVLELNAHWNSLMRRGFRVLVTCGTVETGGSSGMVYPRTFASAWFAGRFRA